MICYHCGERMVGNGHTDPIHCPNLDTTDLCLEPDAAPAHCTVVGKACLYRPPTDNSRALAQAVLNDGTTYEARKQITAEWIASSHLTSPFKAMVQAEGRKAIYEGMHFTDRDFGAAADEVLDHMLNHWKDSQRDTL